MNSLSFLTFKQIVSRTLLFNPSKSILKNNKFSTTVAETVTTVEPKKTLVQKWIEYWNNVYRDYKTVAVDLAIDIKNNPGKSALKVSGLASLGYFAHVTPNAEQFYNEILENHLRLIMVPESIRNKNSEQYIHKLETYHSLNLLRYRNFGIFSLVYYEDYSDEMEIYKKQCDYLCPSYYGYLKERIIDIGFFNNWYFMNDAMKDYDVNFDEWSEKNDGNIGGS